MTEPPTAGIELELWVVDDDGRLADGRELADAHERIEPEFVPPMLEVRTEPHCSVAGLASDLQTVLGRALDAAAAADRHLVPLGTPLGANDAAATTDRGELFERIYGDGIQGAKNCAGTHVHFQRAEDPADVRDQLTVLTAMDPCLALLSSSPYYAGTRGHACARAQAYRRGCGREFRRFTSLWSYPRTLREWRRRVGECFEVFCSLAADRGIDRGTVTRHFSPENTVLNPVRLRECQPTVEWRAPDATLPSQVLQLVGDVRSLVRRAEERPVSVSRAVDPTTSPTPDGTGSRLPESVGARAGSITVPEFGALRSLSQRAIQTGLDSAPVRAYLHALGIDCSAYEPLGGDLRGPPNLSEREVRTRRLGAASRLREDVATLTDVPLDDVSNGPNGQVV